MLIVNAPKFLVMAALQEEPKKPIELKSFDRGRKSLELEPFTTHDGM